jgi:hypothetical protein
MAGLMCSLENLARRCNSAQDNEAAGVLQLRLHLAAGALHTVLHVKPFTRHKFEFQLKSVGFADLVLFHADSGVTLIEAKGADCNRTASSGIGQLFMYEAAYRLQASCAPAYVNKILCAPVGADKFMPTWRACELAGIRFVHLAEFKALQLALDMARQ